VTARVSTIAEGDVEVGNEPGIAISSSSSVSVVSLVGVWSLAWAMMWSDGISLVGVVPLLSRMRAELRRTILNVVMDR
jgi:hypothetical protein